MIRTRLLEPDDWPRLETTDLQPVWRDLQARSDHVDILVAENDAGEIVGHVIFQSLIHCEGFGITEPERRQDRVMRALLSAMNAYCDAHDVAAVWSGSVTPQMDTLLTRRGATRLPGRHYLWSPSAKPLTLPEDSCPSLS